MKPGRKQRRKEANTRGDRSVHPWMDPAIARQMRDLIKRHKLTTAHFDGRVEQPEEVKAFMARAGAPSRQQMSSMCWKQSSSEKERVRSSTWANNKEARELDAFIKRHCLRGGSK
jgi:hypothetical protein